MGIYLPNMEIPNHCGECGIEWCERWKRLIVAGMPSAKARPEDCPLVPVQPHGRLIDADALLSQYNGNIWTAQTDYAEGLRDVVKDIADAPTIIPAEEEP